MPTIDVVYLSPSQRTCPRLRYLIIPLYSNYGHYKFCRRRRRCHRGHGRDRGRQHPQFYCNELITTIISMHLHRQRKPHHHR